MALVLTLATLPVGRHPAPPRLPPGEIGHTPTMRIAATVALSLAGLIGLVGLVGLATLAALRIALC